MRIPFDGVDFVGVPLKRFRRFVAAQLAHVNALIGRTRSEADVRLPVDVQSRSRMEGELLGTLAGSCVPDDGRLVDAGAEDVVSLFVPFQSEDRTFVLSQRAS